MCNNLFSKYYDISSVSSYEHPSTQKEAGKVVKRKNLVSFFINKQNHKVPLRIVFNFFLLPLVVSVYVYCHCIAVLNVYADNVGCDFLPFSFFRVAKIPSGGNDY